MPKKSLEEELTTSFLWLERLNPESQAIIKANLDIAQKEILFVIANTKNQATIQREINKILNNAFAPIESSVMIDNAQITELTWNATQNIMATWTTIEAVKFKDTSAAIKKSLLNPNTLIQGHTLENHLKHLNRTTTRKLQGQIAQGFESGAGIQEINREIRNTLGVLERNQLNTLVRTSLLESIRNSQNKTFDLFEDEIVVYYYNATIDTRTTPRCWSLNNFTSKNKSDITKLLDFHWNCRSILGIKTDLSEEFDKNQKENVVQFDGKTVNHRDGTKSTKFSVDKVKKVSTSASPETSFKALDVKFQKQYMGKTRYDLWRSGKASFDEMTRATRNTFIPLDQLKRNLNLE